MTEKEFCLQGFSWEYCQENGKKLSLKKIAHTTEILLKILKQNAGNFNNYQKQSPISVLYKKCPQKFFKIHRKTSVPDPFFNKVAGKRDSGTGVFLWILRNL